MNIYAPCHKFLLLGRTLWQRIQISERISVPSASAQRHPAATPTPQMPGKAAPAPAAITGNCHSAWSNNSPDTAEKKNTTSPYLPTADSCSKIRDQNKKKGLKENMQIVKEDISFHWHFYHQWPRTIPVNNSYSIWKICNTVRVSALCTI